MKNDVWYGVVIDNDYSEVYYSSSDIDYIMNKIDKHIRSDVKRNRNHSYTIVTLGNVEN